MIRRIFAIILTLTATLAYSAGFAASSAVACPDTVTARDIFMKLPVNVLDLLNKSTRESMLHYFDADSVWQAPNAMEGISELVTVKSDYLKVKLTDVSSLQIKLLPYSGGKLVMTIYNIGEERGGDSDIRFFNSALQEIKPDKFIKMPQLKDFFSIPKGSLTSMKEIEGMLPFYTTIFEATENDDVLTGRITVGEYISRDDYNILKLFLKPSIRYVWTGNRFRLQQ